jgi:hypothetical protein
MKAKLESDSLDTTAKKLKKRRECDRKRAIYFKVSFTDYWRKPIHVTIKRIKSNFPSLSWLRVSMAYSRFQNIRELFQGDLNAKLTRGITSLDFQLLPCNCRNKEACPYDGKCRTPIVVYQATCLTTQKKYIGCTQQHVKTRMQQHVQDVKNLVTRNHRSDSFAAHFGKIIPSNTEKSKIRQHVKIKVDILWKGLPLSCVKTFGTKTCKLCAKERYAILTQLFKDPNGTINKCPEVYGACRHKPRFHRFETTKNVAASADEAEKAERVPGSSSTTTSRTPGSIDSNDSSNRPLRRQA